MKTLKLFIPVTPVPKARPRMGKNGRVYTPKTTAVYEDKLKKFFKDAWGMDTPPMQGPIMAEVWFYMPRPKSVPKKKKYPDTKPDIDNLEKAVFDALDFEFSDVNRKAAKRNKIIEENNKLSGSNMPLIQKIENGRVIDNDSRIVSKISHKRFFDSAGKECPGIEIFIREVEQEKTVSQSMPLLVGVTFTSLYTSDDCKKVTQILLQKNYCPIFIDAGELDYKISKYTAEILKRVDMLCIIDNGENSRNGAKLNSTINIAEKLGTEIFKITF